MTMNRKTSHWSREELSYYRDDFFEQEATVESQNIKKQKIRAAAKSRQRQRRARKLDEHDDDDEKNSSSSEQQQLVVDWHPMDRPRHVPCRSFVLEEEQKQREHHVNSSAGKEDAVFVVVATRRREVTMELYVVQSHYQTRRYVYNAWIKSSGSDDGTVRITNFWRERFNAMPSYCNILPPDYEDMFGDFYTARGSFGLSIYSGLVDEFGGQLIGFARAMTTHKLKVVPPSQKDKFKTLGGIMEYFGHNDVHRQRNHSEGVLLPQAMHFEVHRGAFSADWKDEKTEYKTIFLAYGTRFYCFYFESKAQRRCI